MTETELNNLKKKMVIRLNTTTNDEAEIISNMVDSAAGGGSGGGGSAINLDSLTPAESVEVNGNTYNQFYYAGWAQDISGANTHKISLGEYCYFADVESILAGVENGSIPQFVYPYTEDGIKYYQTLENFSTQTLSASTSGYPNGSIGIAEDIQVIWLWDGDGLVLPSDLASKLVVGDVDF